MVIPFGGTWLTFPSESTRQACDHGQHFLSRAEELFRVPSVAGFSSVRATKGKQMDKVRIRAAAKQIKGSVKKTVGKVTGDAKLEAKGKAEKAAGKGESALGSKKETLFNTFST
jgi:uncharacterized protein YjbJ (UPF0337 family)